MSGGYDDATKARMASLSHSSAGAGATTGQLQSAYVGVQNAVTGLNNLNPNPNPKGGRKYKSNKKVHSRRRKSSKKSQTKRRK
jgi:hypothetical protein